MMRVTKATETCRLILIYNKACFISVHLLFYYRFGTYKGVWDLSEPQTQRSVASIMCRYSFMLLSHIVIDSFDSKLWHLYRIISFIFLPWIRTGLQNPCG